MEQLQRIIEDLQHWQETRKKIYSLREQIFVTQSELKTLWDGYERAGQVISELAMLSDSLERDLERAMFELEDIADHVQIIVEKTE